ncbi:MAG: hypothetical protein US43_C0010G0019 [Candidatus Levybacteria bacterium GW2011_GWA1_37_16]|nr:MAG: hypothetical protein US43_C0010G0019 [Candidatus Levybacteria bacterium GW2011_GWA1_37_16]
MVEKRSDSPVETFTTRTITAVIGDTVVATFQHLVLERDWRIYLKSDDPVEEEKRKAVRQALSDELARFNSGTESFIKEHKRMGCEVEVAVGDASLFPHK